MKTTREDIIIDLGLVWEMLCFMTAGVFLLINVWLYFAFGIIGIFVGAFVSHAIKLKERKRMKGGK